MYDTVTSSGAPHTSGTDGDAARVDGALSFQQEHIWAGAARRFHNVPPLAVSLRGPLSVDAAHEALSDLVHRHQMLRASVCSTVDGLRQQVLPLTDVPLPVHDLTRSGASHQRHEMVEIIGRAARRPFVLGRAPLMRAGLIRLTPTEHVLYLVLHHIITDLWSMKILLREWAQLYAGRGSAACSPAPRYTDYVEWQREWFGRTGDSELAYWASRLGDVPHRVWPAGDEPAGHDVTARAVSMTLGSELTTRLRAAARTAGATLFEFALAAFCITLSRLTGQTTLVVDTLVANRDRMELESMVGLLAASAALRLDVTDDPDVGELLRRVRDESLGAFAHQHLPFRRIAQHLETRGYAISRPRVSFALQSAPVRMPQIEGLALQMVDAVGGADGDGSRHPTWDQSWRLWDRGDHLRIVNCYRVARFRRATITGLLAAFVDVCESMVANPRQRALSRSLS